MKNNPVRVSLDLGPDAIERLERLQVALSEKKIGVFRTALQWLEYVVDTVEDGGKIILEDPEGSQRELVLLGATRQP